MNELITRQPALRSEQANDFSQVNELLVAAFGQDNEARLVEALRKNESAFIPELSIVAVVDELVAGYILFTRILIVDSAGLEYESLSLAPMAVRPGMQESGIGKQLIKFGLEQAKALGFVSVVVLGHPNYYSRFGFQDAEKWHITVPIEVPAGSFMALELSSGSLQHVSGIVHYASEFDGV